MRFLHLSDLHICIEPNRRNIVSLLQAKPSEKIDVVKNLFKQGLATIAHPASYRPSRLSAVAEFTYKNRASYAGVIISGDLATSGKVSDVKEAYNFVATKPDDKWVSAGSPVLQGSSLPVLVMPGNHDNYASNSPIPSPANFNLYFNQQLQEDRYANRVGRKAFIEDGVLVVFIFADFSFGKKSDSKNKRHLYGGGKVQKSVLQELKDRTQNVKFKHNIDVKRVEVFWVVHFAPFDCGSDLELTGYEKILEAAENHGIKAILCGHTHEHRVIKNKTTSIFCAGAATSVDCENAIHEFEYDVHRDEISYRTFNYSSMNGEFS